MIKFRNKLTHQGSHDINNRKQHKLQKDFLLKTNRVFKHWDHPQTLSFFVCPTFSPLTSFEAWPPMGTWAVASFDYQGSCQFSAAFSSPDNITESFEQEP